MTDQPYMDCTRPITQVRPLRGQVLVELLPAPFQIGSISLPPQTKHRAGPGNGEIPTFGRVGQSCKSNAGGKTGNCSWRSNLMSLLCRKEFTTRRKGVEVA